jgi:hypothetical protein
VETQKKKVVVLTMNLDKLRKEHKELAEASLRKSEEQRANHERDFETAREEWLAELESTKQELLEKSEALLQTRGQLDKAEVTPRPLSPLFLISPPLPQHLSSSCPRLNSPHRSSQTSLAESKAAVDQLSDSEHGLRAEGQELRRKLQEIEGTSIVLRALLSMYSHGVARRGVEREQAGAAN